MKFDGGDWALILGGSSGFGLATAKKLARHGMKLCLVHRDRRGAMSRIEPEFEEIRSTGVRLLTRNADALDPAVRGEILTDLAAELAASGAGRVRVLLHSVAFGNLKLVAPEQPAPERLSSPVAPGALAALAALAAELDVPHDRLAAAVEHLFESGVDELGTLAAPPAYPANAFLEDEDFSRTIYSMGTSLLSWTQDVLARGLFADDARVFGLTSEGNEVAWKGYAAVAAAKVALESVSRTMAVELAPYGIRSNVIQAGITETPALRAIPGSAHLKAQARRRNPFRRLTTPADVANVIFLLSTKEAAWVNGEVIRVDGGEHVSGALS
ncbi:MAG: SDR family oxidoreductase [Deltaproteobacteria bacterium]|nr:SDR family oxidoreductase [Deltaproteobacteria bacterium]